MEAQLYTSRLLARFWSAGRPFVGSPISEGAMPMSYGVDKVVAALWDRSDRRSVGERLAGVEELRDPKFREMVLARMIAGGLLVEDGFDEQAAWYRHLEAQLEIIPRVDQVELTNACPFTCLFCPRGLGQMQRPVGHLDLGLLQTIVDQVKHLESRKHFGLHHMGEPMLHPNPAGAVRIVRDAGLHPEISLNPIMLKDKTADALLDAGIDVLILSLDGLDTKTLQAVRGEVAGEIEEVLRRVERVIDRASKMSVPPTVMVSMVSNIHNRHQWRELFRRFHRPEYPWLKPVVRRMDDFGDPTIAPIQVAPLRLLCGAPYTFVSILWDGTVVPCCHDFDGRIVYGNVREQTLREIWQSKVMNDFRERWRRLEFSAEEPCARCGWRVDLFMGNAGPAETDAWSERELWSAASIEERAGSRLPVLR